MQFCSCGNQGVILLLLCCSIIETLETGLEHILLVVKLTLGGFDESVPESSEWCHIVSYRGIGVTGIPQIWCRFFPFNLNETKSDINADFNNFFTVCKSWFSCTTIQFFKINQNQCTWNLFSYSVWLKQKRCILNTLSKHARKVLFWKGFYAISEISDLNDKNSRVIIF